MAKRYADEFRRNAVRIATTSGLTRPQLSSDLGVGLSILNKWVQKGAVAWSMKGSKRALPETEFRRCVGNWGGQLRSSG